MITSKRAATIVMGLAAAIPSVASAKPWKGAELVSQESFRFGAFEARLRAAPGGGLVTPFFLYKNGSEVPGAEWQEMDFEIFGREGTTSFQTQVMTPGRPRTQHVVLHTTESSLADAYHTYRMEWTPQRLAFYLDGVLLREETDAVEYGKLLSPERAESMSLRVSNWAANGPWSGAFDGGALPSHVFVSSLRYERYTPGQGPDGGDFTLAWQDELEAMDGRRWFLANWTFDSALNDYVPENATFENGYLVLSLTEEGQRGYAGEVPPDPLKTPVLPARIEAEAYLRARDTSPGNFGGACRAGDVDLQPTTDENGGACNVGWTTAGEWLEYEALTRDRGCFDIVLRVASNAGAAALHLEIDGTPVGGRIPAPGRGWQTWADATVARVPLATGRHRLRVVFDTGAANLNYLDVQPRACSTALR